MSRPLTTAQARQTVPYDVVVAHPLRALREGLATALAGAGLNSVADAADLGTLGTALGRQPARVVLVALELAPEGRADLLVSRCLEMPCTAVVVLAPRITDRDLLAALEAGALGYLSREESLDRLTYDVKGAVRGEACLPRDKLAPVLRLLIDRRREEDQRQELLRRLSKRETEVLRLIMSGASNDQVAGVLFLSQATVRTHVQNILGKLEVHSRLEAVALGHEAGLTAQPFRDEGAGT